MRIDAATYSDILDLMENIATGSSISEWAQADVDTVRAAITEGEDGTAELQEGLGARAALGRLIGNESQSTALSSLINAASFFGETPQVKWPKEAFRALHDKSIILQEIPDEDIATPELAIQTLIELREAISVEQRELNPDNERIPDIYALATLVLALAAGGRMVGGVQPYARLATARDLFDRSPMLQNTPDTALKSPQLLIAHLAGVREKIIDEQRAINPRKDNKNYALGTLVLALKAGGKIEGNDQPYARLATARDLFDRSPMLQNTPDTALKSPQLLIAHLAGVREKIIDEQRAINPRKDNKNYALGTLVQALKAGGRIEGNVQPYMRFSDAREIYDKSRTLQNIPQKVVDDDKAIMRRLLAQRDRIAVETSRGNMPDINFTTTPGKEMGHGLATLVLALHAGDRIDKKRAIRLDAAVGSPLNYFLKRRNVIEVEVRNLIRLGITRGIFNHIDRDLFTSIADADHVLSDPYTRNIAKWGRWMLTDPDVALRSIYGADEIAFMALLAARIYDINIPKSAVMALEIAAGAAADDIRDARQIAVEALVQINNSFIDGSDVDDKTANFLKWTHRLVEWNADALGRNVAASADGNSLAAEIISEDFAGFFDAETNVILGAGHMLEAEQVPMGLSITTQIGGEYFFTPIAPRFATPAAMPVH
jgi:hypothetical protein